MDVSATRIPAPKPRCGTPASATPIPVTSTGLSPSTASLSRLLRLPELGGIWLKLLHHIRRRLSLRGSVWALPLSVAPTQGIPIGFFSSPYLDVSFRGVPTPPNGGASAPAYASADRRSHSGIPGSKAAYASPGLIAARHALLRRPSLAIHQTASACRVYSRLATIMRWVSLYVASQRIENYRIRSALRLEAFSF